MKYAIGDRADLVVVAQSFGGFTAPLVCHRLPVDLLVLVAGMVPRPAESPDDWIGIDLRSPAKSPWTDGRPDLMYSPSENLLELGYTHVELPGGIAADVEGARALDGTTRRGPWLLAPVAALALALLALIAFRVRRGGATARPALPTS